MASFGISDKREEMAKLLWANEGIRTGELIKLCEAKFGWAKSTTLTVLHILQDKGLFKNEKSTITSVVSEEEYLANMTKEIIDEKYNGSLVQFVRLALTVNTITAEEKEALAVLLK